MNSGRRPIWLHGGRSALQFGVGMRSRWRLAEAIDHLNLYLLFKLPEAESRTVQDKI